jgi:peptidoglycan hydrolase-like protein with peptidoglycan-binding domain
MLKARIRILAVAGIAITVAALGTLSTTAASAATRTPSAASHVTAPRTADASGCVTEDFSEANEGTYEPCVADEQILLNDLYGIGVMGPNQRLVVDGYYGPDTTSDVRSFQGAWGDTVDGITGPQTWDSLCAVDYVYGFQGVYWHDAGCATEPGL